MEYTKASRPDALRNGSRTGCVTGRRRTVTQRLRPAVWQCFQPADT